MDIFVFLHYVILVLIISLVSSIVTFVLFTFKDYRFNKRLVAALERERDTIALNDQGLFYATDYELVQTPDMLKRHQK